jgi:hypothetical protein
MPATQAAGLLLHTWVTDITAHNIPAWGTFHHGSCLLHCTALHHVPHHAMLRYTTAHYTMPHYATLGYTHYMPHYATHYTTLHYTTTHHTRQQLPASHMHPTHACCLLQQASTTHTEAEGVTAARFSCHRNHLFPSSHTVPGMEAEPQQIVAQRLLSCLQYPLPYLSRLQRI